MAPEQALARAPEEVALGLLGTLQGQLAACPAWLRGQQVAAALHVTEI